MRLLQPGVDLIKVVLNEAETAALVDRLAQIEGLRDSPRAEREWLVAHGELRRYDAGEVMMAKTQDVDLMAIMLAGKTTVYLDHGTGRRHVIEAPAGTVTALLPYSRLVRPYSDVVIEEPTEMLAIYRDHVTAMPRECPVTTASLVHVMIDRARRISATDWHDEKMVSLGRLAAGIAHELNNPASAAARGAKNFGEAMRELGEAARAFGAMGLSDEQRTFVEDRIRTTRASASVDVLAPLERADREEEIADWMASRTTEISHAALLAESGVTVETLNELAARLPREALPSALRWFAAASNAQSLASDVERATTKIHDLVSSVKRFTFMDRAATLTPTDISLGLADTVAVLASKARQKSVAVRLSVAPDLPMVMASVAELNQVWSNLLENALDAVPEGGAVAVRANTDGNAVLVCVSDNGPGIPSGIMSRIFDPFFTTKGVGEGVGLGLDIARRMVRSHQGQIDVESLPGRTEFRVRLPMVSADDAMRWTLTHQAAPKR